jgi:uncharacterized caspase-like protein
MASGTMSERPVMNGWTWRLCAAILLCFAMPATAQSQEKALNGVALVIGNGDYEHIAKLDNPPNDARAIEEMLADLGFETSIVSDRDARRLRRDLEAFVEDAEGADVAFLYYSGHGIEAGGENFLVPVDADLAALDAAAEKLVPISALVEQLKATVPVAIVMLDACRDDPFPPGALVRLQPGAEPAPIGTAGLGETRGATALGATSGADESFGAVIGFAAEPGKVALDGPAGGYSPYAAAVLRHLSALGGEEFGTVMRMVAEEVYLKTEGAQRPWINESLRRLLYFGGEAVDPTGEEGDILTERRQLLLTISFLPEAGRKRIETIASADGVPMDALYGMLKALGTDAPQDPSELDALLRSQTEKLKSLLAERQALKSTDPEITRLASLADQALGEGAMATALKLLDQAKSRVGTLKQTVDQAEADIRARRLEFAAVYARSAEARSVVFDYARAAEDYALAFEQVEKWDDSLALDYKNSEAESLTFLGENQGDRDALVRSAAAGEAAVKLAAVVDPSHLTRSRIIYGNALQALGNSEPDTATLERAIVVYREAIDALDRSASPTDWATLQNNAGNVLAMIARRQGNPAKLGEAADAYRLALEEFTKTGPLTSWLFAMNNLAKALLERAELEAGVERLNEAAGLFEQALARASRQDQPLQWAIMQNNYANVLQTLGMRTADPAEATRYHQAAATAYSNALLEWTPERAASHRAIAQNNLGNVYQSLAYRDLPNAAAHLTAAEDAQSEALSVTSRAEQPLQWAAFAFNRGRTHHMLGDFSPTEAGAIDNYRRSADDFRAALTEMTFDRVPLQWGGAQMSLGNVLQALALRSTDSSVAVTALEESVAAHQVAIEGFVGEAYAAQRANSLQYQANAYILLGERGGGLPRFREAEAAYREALALSARETQPVQWAYALGGLANALRAIGLASGDRVVLAEAKAMTQKAWDTIKPYDNQFDGLLAGRIAEIDAALAKN